ncbi:MAG TPA: hypothetical protein VMB03_34450 [Bryobacteraceae bacterium]|nr:hypothetical protein [Bryobacteraceae bacterium]
MRFFYAAPDRIRYEPPGAYGTVQVSDGTQSHTLFGHRGFSGGRRYRSGPAAKRQDLPHLFRPDFPLAGGNEPLLFEGIDQRVTSAEILRDEDACNVVAVTYEPPPYAGFMLTRGPILFWINSENRMVMRQQGEIGHRMPTEDEVHWTRHTISVTNLHLNQPLPDDVFQFIPPADAILEPAEDGRISGGGGGGFSRRYPDSRGSVEHFGHHEWQGETLVEHSKWKLRGLNVTFERRLTFSNGENELRIEEHATGPGGESGASYNLPLK